MPAAGHNPQGTVHKPRRAVVYPSSDMLRGVAVGCGFFSRIQMEAWKRMPGVEMVAACDLDQPKLQRFAADFGLAAYDDLDRMIDEAEPDFIDIVTRPSTHLALTRQAVGRGLPTLLQKPIAPTYAEGVEIARVAAESGVRVMINENWRWQRWYREIDAMIRAGRIGGPFYYSMQARAKDGLGPAPFPNQPYFKDMPRFLLFETLVHHIDTARFLFGDFEEVYCQTGKLNPIMAGEDIALILTVHRSGVRGVIDGNRATEPEEPGQALEVARFEGFEAMLRLRHSGDVWLGSERVFDASGAPGYRGDSCYATQRHFVDCLASGEPFESEVGEYLRKTFAVVEACYRSAAEHRPVTIAEVAEGDDS